MKYDKVTIVNYPKLTNKEGIILNDLFEGKSLEVMVEGMIVILDKSQVQYTNKRLDIKTLKLPRLNGLPKIDLVSTMLKITEEAGELSQVIGKKRGMNGEKIELSEKEQIDEIAKELLDVAQAAITMLYVLEKEHAVKIDTIVDMHIQKLIRKGYVI